MIAHYGYEDGSGAYFISIDTDKCSNCNTRGCLAECPQRIFTLELDDWDNEIAVIEESARNELKVVCAECKTEHNRPLFPCQVGCSRQAIIHSW